MKNYKNEKMKVAIYIRVANKETVREDSSIEMQRHIANAYLKNSKGIKSKEFYIDNGFSGTTYNRPEFKRMLKDIKSQKVNTIIVKDLSRFGRKLNAIDKIDMLKKDYGTNFIAIDDKIDTINKVAEFNLRKLIYEMYRADMKQRSELSKKMKKRRSSNPFDTLLQE